MITERIAKGFLAIVLRGNTNKSSPLQTRVLVKYWGRSYHLKKIYQQQIIHVSRKNFKNVIYVAIEEVDDNQGEVVSSFANIYKSDQHYSCLLVKRICLNDPALMSKSLWVSKTKPESKWIRL